jgi:hypothetical protein
MANLRPAQTKIINIFLITFDSSTHTGFDCVKNYLQVGLIATDLNLRILEVSIFLQMLKYVIQAYFYISPRTVRRINWVKGIIPLPVNIFSKLRFPHENSLYRKTCFPVTVYVRNSKQSTLQT